MNGDYSSEKKLVEKAIRGEKTAQAKIVSDNERLVYNTALKLLANETEAECVLQETFLKVFQALPTFKGQSSLSTWIYRIATNYALMRLRARKKEAADLDESQSDISQDTIDTFNRALGNNPLNTVINNELRESMQQAIEELPPKFRSVFILKDIEGYSLKEIAEMLDMTLAAVKSNLHRARLFLRDRLANYVGSEPLIQP
ncbi:sigma-70 family RNA polymerase sigma factor [candidate division KSB1 bacterium]|nr:sigma-70 family RNA polymerase sigma factor [candidate division KSB1 bacterium]